MMKLSRDSIGIIIATGGMILLGVLFLLASPIWPEFMLAHIGRLTIGFGIILALFAFLAIEIDKREARRAEKRSRREMRTRFQEMK